MRKQLLYMFVVFFIAITPVLAIDPDLVLKISVDGKENTLVGTFKSEAVKILKEKVASDALVLSTAVKRRALPGRNILLEIDRASDISLDIQGKTVAVTANGFSLRWADDGRFVEKVKALWSGSYPLPRLGPVPQHSVWKGGCPNSACAVAKKLDELYAKCSSCENQGNCSNCSVRFSIMKLTQICKDKCNASW